MFHRHWIYPPETQGKGQSKRVLTMKLQRYHKMRRITRGRSSIRETSTLKVDQGRDSHRDKEESKAEWESGTKIAKESKGQEAHQVSMLQEQPIRKEHGKELSYSNLTPCHLTHFLNVCWRNVWRNFVLFLFVFEERVAKWWRRKELGRKKIFFKLQQSSRLFARSLHMLFQ